MRNALILFILLSTLTYSYGQLTITPIKRDVSKKTQKSSRTEGTTLSLPFWDDFSFAKDFVPSDSLWVNSESVYIGDGLGLNPPSIGVASFDGIKSDGGSYSGSTTASTDSLTSCPIDLSGLTAASNVYLSFFYQFGGNGETPEETDSLRVEFKNADGQWIPVWPQGAAIDRSGDFVQALIKVDSANHLHDQFQFRIQAFGRPQGFYDIWNVDYVYLNKGRSPSDNHYPDRTISSPLTSIFDGFYAIPARHYRTTQNKVPSYKVSSVDNPNDDPQPYDNFYYGSLELWKDNAKTVVNTDTIFRDTESLKNPQVINETIDNLFDNLTIPEGQDSIFISLKTFIDATDNALAPTGDYDVKYSPIDFRVNDTIRNEYILKDYYAYDDGTAEFGAGLNFAGNSLAIKFPVTPSVTDTLIAVEMYFPLSQTDPTGRSIDIIVWENDTVPINVLMRETFTLGRDPKPNTFIRYYLKSPVTLSEDFYLGYRQNGNGQLSLGFDISNVSTDKAFFNLGNLWQTIPESNLSGSFMLRPVFGETIPFDPTTGIENDREQTIVIYPNPSSGVFNIRGRFDNFEVFDMYGKSVAQEHHASDEPAAIDLSALSDGLYFVRVKSGIATKTLKIIKK
ncbi:T9SS type A sorting domain-containing protein [Fulvivirga sp.]|uniref:T9SS type A sorting domain-containing protein n=1 Tax=Fulvivirga sp. TaxID=1931237 RepID=UPI0032EE1080